MPSGEEPDDEHGFTQPLPPDDRLWRHPSELREQQAPDATSRIMLVNQTRLSPRVWIVAAVSSLVGAGAMLALLAGIGSFDPAQPEKVIEQIQQARPRDPEASDLAIAEQVIPAVARIDVDGTGAATGGTAVVFRSDGHMLTTADAVDGAETIGVTFSDGRSATARVVGVDRNDDLAVLKVDLEGLTGAVLGQTDALQLGEPIITIVANQGMPEAPTVRIGLINSLNQPVTTQATSLYDMIQTNVQIDDGRAGAVLIDRTGSVIGIVTSRGPTMMEAPPAGAKDAQPTQVPMMFATPIGYAKHIADQIIDTGRVARPWLGVEAVEPTDKERTRLGRTGALITAVTDDSPASQAGLQVGDVITSIDGEPLGSMSALVVAVRTRMPDDVVALGYVRDGEAGVSLVRLSERASAP